jgi:monoamine oxidase
MSSTRREFLKFVVVGSVAAGCPLDLSLLAAPDAQPMVDGEHNTICHEVRDGHRFPRPTAFKRCDVAIVGGGPSGMAAAYFLGNYNFLLLEKEPHWGGNAYLEEYEGQAFSTGAAFDFKDSDSDHLARELGLKMLPINFPDPTIVNGRWVADTWRGGLDELPYSASVRESFKKFKRDMLALNVEAHPEQYDREPLGKYLNGHAPEVRQWWDGYGPSNWGAKAAETSTWVAMQDFADMTSEPFHDDRVTLPGGNGAISRRLAEALLAKHRDRMLAGATAFAVEQEKQGVKITYLHQGRVVAVTAKAAIMATPKFITARIVHGIPLPQLEAMNQIRYAPYPVVNLIFDRPVYNRGYDTWCPGNSFTDFIVADWTIRHEPGYKQKNNILTMYTPLPENQRERLLTIEGGRQIALNVLRDFQRLMPEFKVDPVEVRMYRRGHPMFMATPGTYTKLIPAANHPMERVFFANTDSLGPESLTAGAVKMGRAGAEWAEKLLARGAKSAGLLGVTSARSSPRA